MYTLTRFLIIIALFAYSNKLSSQKDTLHINYQGLQTAVADSSYAKITKWAKTLKGKHSDVEILAYYENVQYKKYMKERAENLELVVIRLARDYITIKFSGPVKGKKSQRSMADIVYTSGNAPTPPVAVSTEAKKENAATSTETKKESTAAVETYESTNAEAASSAKHTEKAKPAEKSSEKAEPVSNGKYEYIMDSTYVNGVLKVKKRKVKKQ